MHRTIPVPHTAFRLMVVSLLLGASAAAARAADELAPPPRRDGAVLNNILYVPIGSSQTLQMTSRKVIKTVVNPKDTVAVVTPKAGDPRSVLVTGRDAGITRITLTADDNTEETFQVIVQLDVEYLRNILVRTIPTANVRVIPGAGSTI